MQDFVRAATKATDVKKPTVSWTIYVTKEQERVVETFRTKFGLTRQDVMFHCFSAGLEQMLACLSKEVRDEIG
jgi:Tat protein secretion system quality control protein TatD with DNase activity